jgi:addiction module HigA family antidote
MKTKRKRSGTKAKATTKTKVKAKRKKKEKAKRNAIPQPMKVKKGPMHFPTHPGDVIQQKFITPKKWTQGEFADKLGWPLTRVNKLINGKGGITADSAIDLSKVLGTKPEYWMNLQMEYELKYARASRRR